MDGIRINFHISVGDNKQEARKKRIKDVLFTNHGHRKS